LGDRELIERRGYREDSRKIENTTNNKYKSS